MAYREALKSYSATQIDRGCRECLRTLKFFPKPAEIIEAMAEDSTGDYAPPVRGLLPEPKLTDAERENVRKLLDHAKAKLGNSPIVAGLPKEKPSPKVFIVTEEARIRLQNAKKKLGVA